MVDELLWHMREPDFTQPLWKSIEAKLGRTLTPKENEYIFRRSGMFKEWLFREVKGAEEAERILAGTHRPAVYQPVPLWKQIINFIFK